MLRQEGHDIEYIPKYKEIPGITNDVDLLTDIHTKRLYDLGKPDEEMFNYALFKHNDTIIAESCTGTGKSHAVLKEHVPRYLEDNPHMKLLTLTNKRNLSDQHIDDYPSLKDYRTLSGYPEGSLTCCLNSIAKLAPLSDDALRQYIVYIDEIDSF